MVPIIVGFVFLALAVGFFIAMVRDFTKRPGFAIAWTVSALFCCGIATLAFVNIS